MFVEKFVIPEVTSQSDQNLVGSFVWIKSLIPAIVICQNVIQFLQSPLRQFFLAFLFQLRRAVVDHVSDSFLETTMPLIMLIEAAQAGNEREVEECATLFIDHAAKLEEVRAARGKGIPSQLAQNNSYLKTICVNLIVWRLGWPNN